MRASREAFGFSTGGRATPISFSRRSGEPSVWAAYIGWKQPAAGAAGRAAASSRAAMRTLADNNHEPPWKHRHLNHSLAAQRRFYRIERQNGSLDVRILGSPWHGDITPLLAVNLHHQRYIILNQQIAFDLRPIGLRNQAGLAQHLPAFFRQMRHHG